MNTNAPQKMTNYRWVICAMLFLATTVNYMDRQASHGRILLLLNFIGHTPTTVTLQPHFPFSMQLSAFSLASSSIGWAQRKVISSPSSSGVLVPACMQVAVG